MKNLPRFHLSTLWPLLFVGLLLTGRPAQAQVTDTCLVLADTLGNYLVSINDSPYLAFPLERARRLQFKIDSLEIELTAERKKVAANQALIAALENTNESYQRHFWIADSLMEQTNSLYEGYRDLYFSYKRAYSEPWFAFNGGLGAVKDDNNDVLPVVLLGLSIKRLSLWGFVNQQQSGFILGLNYPIRFSLF